MDVEQKKMGSKRKILQLSYIVLIAITMINCSGKRKGLAENTTKEFFSAIKNDNSSKISDLYPDFGKIGTYYKSDEIVIKETKALNDKKVSVMVENSFTNGFGKKFNQTINLYLKPDENDKNIYKIYDSKGITGYEEKEEYIFAVKTGGIKKNVELTDQETAKKLKIASKLMVKYVIEMLLELKTNVKVVSWSWENGYGGSASGKAIVKNNSDFNLPKLKYKITYYRNGDEITTDDGYVTHDKFMAGMSKSFTFYTSYVGNANTANISLDFDTEMILNYLTSKEYTGKEYEEFLATENKDDVEKEQ
jgi:hypothetical protein